MQLDLRTLEQALDTLFQGFSAVFEACQNQITFQVSGSRFQCHSQFDSYIERVNFAAVTSDFEQNRSCKILVAQAGTPGVPKLVWADGFFQDREVEALLKHTRYRLHYYKEAAFWQVFDRETCRGIQIMTGADGAPEWDSGSPLRNFIHWHLSAPGAGLIHAGTLGIKGEGVLLVGEGGSGKSGTVLAGVMNGLETVGDDYVFIRYSGAEVWANPVFRTVKQDPSGLARLGITDAPYVPRQRNWQGKYQFTLTDMEPKAPAQAVRIHAVILPVITKGGQFAFHPVTAKEAFLALVPSGVAQVHGDRDATFALSAKLTRSLPCYTLELGPDPAQTSGAIKDFIHRLTQ